MNGSIELEQYQGLDEDIVQIVDPTTHKRTLLRSASSLTLAANSHVLDGDEEDMKAELKDDGAEFAKPMALVASSGNNTNDNAMEVI